MDTVYIKGIRANTTIGVYEHERDILQPLVINLEMDCDTRAAGRSDDFNDALDYDAISKRALSFVEQSKYFLIEAVAENLASTLLTEFAIDTIRVHISKPQAVDIAEDVGVRIQRSR